ncbi:hypothetical protein N9145_02210 [bacterium]|nr:hypothetical protein [bacterium]
MSSNLMEKLAVSKKIMEKHNGTPRTQGGSLPMADNTNASYNIPQDMLQQPQQQQPNIPTPSMSNEPVTENAIKNSKLPDAIKRLMLENPITQPQSNGPALSNDIIEGAARLMKNNSTSQPNELVNTKQPLKEVSSSTSLNNDLKQMIRDVVRDTVRDVVREELKSSGMVTEGNQKVNETLSLRVGKHVFEGKVLKVKKVKQ